MAVDYDDDIKQTHNTSYYVLIALYANELSLHTYRDAWSIQQRFLDPRAKWSQGEFCWGLVATTTSIQYGRYNPRWDVAHGIV